MRQSRRVFALSVTLIMLSSVAPMYAPPPAAAQVIHTEAAAQANYTVPAERNGLSGTEKVSIAANGSTTVVENLSGDEPEGYGVEQTTEVVTKDGQGNVVKRTSEYSWTVYDRKGGKQKSRQTENHTDTFDAKGGYSRESTRSYVDDDRTIDDSIQERYDANDNRLSGEWTETYHYAKRPSEVHKMRFNPDKGEWRGVASNAQLQPEQTAQQGIPQQIDPDAPRGSAVNAGNETAYLPDVAGPSSQIVATFVDPESAGPSGATIAMVMQDGAAKYYHATSDPDGHVIFNVAAGTATVLLFKGFDHGQPDKAAARCQIVQNGTVPQTNPVPNAPASGLAIMRGSSAYQRGGSGNGLFSLQTRGNDPIRSHVLLDDKTINVQTLAASDQSLKARIGDVTPLGRHTVSLASGQQTSNAFPTDIVTLRADPVPPSQVGTVQTLSVHTLGLPATDPATMAFTIGGSAELADGGSSITVPVTNGVAQVQIRGVRAGAALLRFLLHAKIAGFWE